MELSDKIKKVHRELTNLSVELSELSSDIGTQNNGTQELLKQALYRVNEATAHVQKAQEKA